MSGARLARPKGQLWAHPIVTGESCTGLGTSLGEGHLAGSPHFFPSVWLPYNLHNTNMIRIVYDMVPQG
jgi:hypothetical protein